MKNELFKHRYPRSQSQKKKKDTEDDDQDKNFNQIDTTKTKGKLFQWLQLNVQIEKTKMMNQTKAMKKKPTGYRSGGEISSDLDTMAEPYTH